MFSSQQSYLAAKEKEIELLLEDGPNIDLWKLRELALSTGGLLNDNIRKRAWPLLVGVYDATSSSRRHGIKRFPSQEIKFSRRLKRHRPNKSAKQNKEDEDVLKFSTLLSSSSLRSSGDSDVNNTTPINNAEEGKTGTSPFFCLDALQIELDVARCTRHIFSEKDRKKQRMLKKTKENQFAMRSLLEEKQKRLDDLINLALLRTYEDDYEGECKLRYYQGYHDVASVFLSTLDEEKDSGFPVEDCSSDSVNFIASSKGFGLCHGVLTQLSMSHFGDAMKTNFLHLRTTIQLVWMPLLYYFDREVHDFLYDCEMEPFFLLSWIITWFSHDIHDTSLVKRLFDVFLVSHPLFPLYLALAMVCHPYNREEILLTDCDFAQVHVTLSGLPRNSDTAERSVFNEFAFDSSDKCVVGREEIEKQRSSSFDGGLSNNEDDDEAPSLAPTSPMTEGSTCGSLKAPFQEIIDLALKFMERLPPSSVIKISQRYHVDDHFEPMMSIAPSITMLQSHPWWGLVSTPEAGRLLLEMHDDGDESSSSADHFCETEIKSKMKQSQTLALEINNDDKVVFIRWHSKNPAVIACGYGRGERMYVKHRLLKRFALLSAAIIAFLPSELWSITEVTKQLDIGLSSYFDMESSLGSTLHIEDALGIAARDSCLSEDNKLSFLATSLSTCDIK